MKVLLVCENLVPLKQDSAIVFMKLDINVIFKNYSRKLLSINQEVISTLACFQRSMENLAHRRDTENTVPMSRPGKAPPNFISTGLGDDKTMGDWEWWRTGEDRRVAGEWRGCPSGAGLSRTRDRAGYPVYWILRLQNTGLRTQNVSGEGTENCPECRTQGFLQIS